MCQWDSYSTGLGVKATLREDKSESVQKAASNSRYFLLRLGRDTGCPGAG